ncbi:hypothetical protein [Gymnodinialimonas hymeniacidonis]|uniref:hypothetical protein n=1 Tax=Gymnodinialimonas hymeniacidonis TaxID=3126508 RepID=UPI0034C6689F
MEHLEAFRHRPVHVLPLVERDGWRLKRYGIVADGRALDMGVADAASAAAVRGLPEPGAVEEGSGNHGAWFQIVHFAQTAVVSPIFYWQWGSVLSHGPQMRAPWEAPTAFAEGFSEIVGCIWEMELVAFEVDLWKRVMLGDGGDPEARLARYLEGAPG